MSSSRYGRIWRSEKSPGRSRDVAGRNTSKWAYQARLKTVCLNFDFLTLVYAKNMFPDRQNSGAHGEDTCQVHVRQFRVKRSCTPNQAIGYILRRVPSRLVQKTTIFVFSTRALSLWSRTGNIQREVVRVATDSYHEYRGLSFPSDTYYPPGSSRGSCTLTPAKHLHEKAAHTPKPI